MRQLLLALLVAVSAHAQVVTTHLLLPSYGGSTQIRFPTTANAMRCYRIPARLGITNATKMAGGVQNSLAGTTISFALYVDDDAGARLAVITGVTSGPTVLKATGLPAFSLVQGTVYRLCTCASTAGGSSVLYTGIYDTQGAAGSSDGSAGSQSDVLNAVVTRAGYATEPCVAGVAPLTTGTLTSVTHRPAPLVLVEN